MSNKWRVIIDEALPGSQNMAIDYAIVNAVAAGVQPPTLRFYQWNHPSITIGYFQSPEQEVYLDEAKKRDIPVIRRITGGGTVFHHQELTYSFVIPISHPMIKGEILDSFKTVCSPLIKTLKELGIPAEYQPINDITADGKKISGNAQIRKSGVLLQHGTILLDIDKESIGDLLTGKGSDKQHIIDEKTGEKTTKPVNHVTRVGSLIDFLGDDVLTQDFRSHFESKAVKNYSTQFDIQFSSSSISRAELQDAKIIEKDRFNNPEWNLNRISP